MSELAFTFHLNENGVEQDKPLLYLWEIYDAYSGVLLHSYVGKAKGGSKRPLKHYRRNVLNLLHGRPYRRGKFDKFRASHRALAEAILLGHRIVLSFLRNVELDAINAVERQEIIDRAPDLNQA
ncbi:hypothetical protein [Silvimonas sp.]|uniref:hypothetical protein n=1 Tax=Silvimonas sp. TaxID=2650811 RepID=UPI00284C1940|nr:hypothetical protein [Silvimonas sp.]MDR3429986.1 hypothetical protein [Silvimonas sp.]